MAVVKNKTKKASLEKVRMNFRLSRAVKERIVRAAKLTGQSLSGFAVSTLAREADEILARHTTITLADQDRDFFLAVLDDEGEPSARSLAAARRYRTRKQ